MRDVVWGEIWIMGTQLFPHPGVQRGFWWGYGAVSIFAPSPGTPPSSSGFFLPHFPWFHTSSTGQHRQQQLR